MRLHFFGILLLKQNATGNLAFMSPQAENASIDHDPHERDP